MRDWFRRRRECGVIDPDYLAWLEAMTPFKAKVHISAIDDIFTTLNEYLPPEQHIRINLKVPLK